MDINDALMREAKRIAARTGRTLTSIVEDALRERLAHERAGAQAPFKLQWPTVKGKVHAGVDITDRDSLYERMDGRS